jgi:hypothetical protein
MQSCQEKNIAAAQLRGDGVFDGVTVFSLQTFSVASDVLGKNAARLVLPIVFCEMKQLEPVTETTRVKRNYRVLKVPADGYDLDIGDGSRLSAANDHHVQNDWLTP